MPVVISLPPSKSISNRALIINALAENEAKLSNLSDCDDTRAILRVLNSSNSRFDIGNAGTAMRFLTAFLARIFGTWELSGSSRMHRRPVGILVDALNRIGADIRYAGEKGYPPLRIHGSLLTGGELEVSASVSSQFISALMMVAPTMLKGLTLHLTGKVTSAPYIQMTAHIMRAFGVQVDCSGNDIRILPQSYTPPSLYEIEADWSAASYFFEWMTLARKGELLLRGLRPDSIQGDACQVKLWAQLGVAAEFVTEGLVIWPDEILLKTFKYDFSDMPDLVQSFAVACCLLNVPFSFTGVNTLRMKETDRLDALVSELRKLGYLLEAGDAWLIWNGTRCESATAPLICTYGDHRMAMAFAPALLKYPALTIENRDVVTKSFPGFWNEFSFLPQ